MDAMMTWMTGRQDDEEYVTRALQMPFSEDNSIFNLVNFPSSLLGLETPPSPPPEVQRHVAKPGAGRVSKRKPRTSKKRSQTTFIAADPANFRQMVQQVTGIKVAGDWGSQVVKPAPQRPPIGLPALDTWSFPMGGHVLHRPYPGHVLHQLQEEEVAHANGPGPGPGPGGYIGLEAFSGFPTLDSWRVII